MIERSIILDLPSNQGSQSSDCHNDDENWNLVIVTMMRGGEEDDATGDVHRELLPRPGRRESFRGQSARVEEDPGARCVSVCLCECV